MSAQPIQPFDSGARALSARGLTLGVRPVRAEDLDAVAAIEQAIYPFPWSRGNFADSLRAGYDAWLFESTSQDGVRAVGYAIVMWLPDEVHLLNLSVAADVQGRGFGRAMLQWLMADARRRGAPGMLLEVRPSNQRAIALYHSLGFRQIGVRKRYYPSWNHSREDAWVLRREFDDE
ncbi:MAG: ribosomal protein S18-alanine N-acetyltransferase [Burkholderiaceae bacterium]